MKCSEVQELLKAGFTADEIRGMLNEPVNPQTDNPQIPQDSPQEQPEEQPSPVMQAQTEQPVNTETDERFNQLNSTMEKLIKTIQSSNLNNSSFNSVSEPDINTKVDKIMASIIRPEREKGGND